MEHDNGFGGFGTSWHVTGERLVDFADPAFGRAGGGSRHGCAVCPHWRELVALCVVACAGFVDAGIPGRRMPRRAHLQRIPHVCWAGRAGALLAAALGARGTAAGADLGESYRRRPAAGFWIEVR